MKLRQLRLRNFRSFGDATTQIDLDDISFVLGPNGSGKTALLQALARMFGTDPSQRKLRKSDFHIPLDDDANEPMARDLSIEADFEFPELAPAAEDQATTAVPGNFLHMQLVAPDGPARVRFRLFATLDEDGEIEEQFTYVLRTDGAGVPEEETRVAKQDRNAIQVHYLPARRDPADHISYSTNALLGRVLRAANWSAERATVDGLTQEISQSLAQNEAIASLAEVLTSQWGSLHSGTHFANPSVSFARSEIETILRHMSLVFAPGIGEQIVDFSRLSDGQQSVLYLSIVLAVHALGRKALAGELDEAFDIDKLRPAIFTLIAVEEPENSLSPHYLGRVVQGLTTFSAGDDAQAVLATHSAAMMRRVPPEQVRYLRLNSARTTMVRTILLPESEANAEAHKFIREAVQAFPELYFARYVVLGEGDSEEVVLPRLMAASGMLADTASISVVPLGGRHVNHFWRLLHELRIPHITLLDLDLARFGGGWGRIKYAATQLRRYRDVHNPQITMSEVHAIPAWDGPDGLMIADLGWIARLEALGVFFSSPLDLDLAMLIALPEAYEVEDDERGAPDEATKTAVLGKSHDTTSGQYEDDELELFEAYNTRFKNGSKPACHVQAMSGLDDAELLAGAPEVLSRLVQRIRADLETVPE